MSEPFGMAQEAERRKRETGIGLATVRADRIAPKRVAWVWPGRIPAGKVTMLDGDPGLGKSCITIDLTARVSTASPFPDGHKPDKARCVLLLSAEDGVEDTIVPRLQAAGANRKLVTIVDHVADDGGPRPVELPADIDRIEKWCASLIYADDDSPDAFWTTPGLVIIDPLTAFLAGEVNAHRDQDVRRVLFRLKVMAEETGCAVVCVRHLNKAPGTNPLYRGGGSIGIIGAARSGLLVGVDPDDEDRRILAVSKSNLAAKAPSLAYRVLGATFRHGDEQIPTVRIAWDGASEHTAEDLLGRPVERSAPKQDAAEDFLRNALGKEARPVAWLQKLAKDKRISWSTVKRAKDALEVIVERRGEEGRRGGGAWWWRLPAGQLQLKETATDTTPDGALNPDPESAGQDPDSEAPAVKETTDHERP
jgi:AAA domain